MGDSKIPTVGISLASNNSSLIGLRPNGICNANDWSIRSINQTPLRSTFFGRSPLYPHLRHLVARQAFRALHFMQILTRSKRASASGNRAMIPPTCSLYLTST